MLDVALIVVAAPAVAIALHYRCQAARRRLESALWRSRANVRGRLLRTAWGRECGPSIDPATAGRIPACPCSHAEEIAR